MNVHLKPLHYDDNLIKLKNMYFFIFNNKDEHQSLNTIKRLKNDVK